MKGLVVSVNPKTGMPHNHVNEVRENLLGLVTTIQSIKSALANNQLTPQARAALEAALSRASKMADKARSSVPGISANRSGARKSSNRTSKADEAEEGAASGKSKGSKGEKAGKDDSEATPTGEPGSSGGGSSSDSSSSGLE